MLPQLLSETEENRTYLAIQVSLHYVDDPQDLDTYRKRALRTMQHELGHLIAYIHYGSTYPNHEWKNAAVKDRMLTYDIGKDISEYDNHNFEQDFAEAVAIYLRTYGEPEHAPKIGETITTTRSRYFHRFAILDRIMSTNPSKSFE